MKKCFLLISVIYLASQFSNVAAQPDPNFHLYLLLGQSNMAGGCKDAIQGDCDTTSRVKLIAFTTCTNKTSEACTQYTMNREHNKWYTAYPPYHNCSEGIGPADHFGKTLLDSIRDDISIGFIPCALSGQSIDLFVKGSTDTVPSWAHSIIRDHVYDWIVSRCNLGKEKGVIKGILFHQGESDNGSSSWVDKTKGFFDDLKQDAGLYENIPIVVGELLQDEGACCTLHNPLINQLASEYPNCAVASSEGLKMRPGDEWNAHFDCDGVRELGRRFAVEFLKIADNDYVPRKGTVPVIKQDTQKAVSIATVRSWKKGAKIYTFNGRFIAEINAMDNKDALRNIKSGNVYVVFQKSTGNARLMVLP